MSFWKEAAKNSGWHCAPAYCDGPALDGDELALAWAAARRARVAAAGATHILCEQHRSHGAWGPGPAGPDLQDIAATLAGLRYVCPDDPAGARAEINLQHISDDQGIIDTDL